MLIFIQAKYIQYFCFLLSNLFSSSLSINIHGIVTCAFDKSWDAKILPNFTPSKKTVAEFLNSHELIHEWNGEMKEYKIQNLLGVCENIARLSSKEFHVNAIDAAVWTVVRHPENNKGETEKKRRTILCHLKDKNRDKVMVVSFAQAPNNPKSRFVNYFVGRGVLTENGIDYILIGKLKNEREEIYPLGIQSTRDSDIGSKVLSADLGQSNENRKPVSNAEINPMKSQHRSLEDNFRRSVSINGGVSELSMTYPSLTKTLPRSQLSPCPSLTTKSSSSGPSLPYMSPTKASLSQLYFNTSPTTRTLFNHQSRPIASPSGPSPANMSPTKTSSSRPSLCNVSPTKTSSSLPSSSTVSPTKRASFGHPSVHSTSPTKSSDPFPRSMSPTKPLLSDSSHPIKSQTKMSSDRLSSMRSSTRNSLCRTPLPLPSKSAMRSGDRVVSDISLSSKNVRFDGKLSDWDEKEDTTSKVMAKSKKKPPVPLPK